VKSKNPTDQMREGTDPGMSMSVGGYLSASDTFDITEPPQYYGKITLYHRNQLCWGSYSKTVVWQATSLLK